MPQLVLIPSSLTDPTDQYIEQSLKKWKLDDNWQQQYITWDRIWSFLGDVIFKRANADIIEVGTTWISSYVGMKAFRPFTSTETDQIQRAGNFLPIAWKNSMPRSENQAWSIPWASDVRIVYYWAGVDPQTAFRDIPSFEAALEQLQAHGIQAPWIDTTTLSGNTVYRAGMWIWGHAGDYLSSDGKKVLFTEQSAINGLQAYFGLHRFMPDAGKLLDEVEIAELFYQRKVACIITGHWLVKDLVGTPRASLLSQIGAALPPVPPFVGGTHLVVMQHMAPQYEQSAIDLITHLVSKEFAIAYSEINGHFFPIRADLLDLPQIAHSPFSHILFQALQIGRTLPAATRWSIVEDGLSREFAGIWADIKKYPNQPLESIIMRRLEPLAKRLNRTLAV